MRGFLTTIVVVAGNRRRRGIWRKKAEMIGFSSKGNYNDIAKDGDREFYAKALFICNYYSIVTQVDPNF